MPIITLDKLEDILRRETAVIASEDVAILMATIYEEAATPAPQRLLDEAEANNNPE